MAADTLHARGSVRTAVVWEALRAALARATAATGRDQLDILDAGGGTGGFAVPLALLGHGVTVVDPNLDSLAALERRSAEAEVRDRVRPVQGDAADLLDVVDADSFDVVLCHSVLEVVDDPGAAVAAVAATVRVGGALSLLAANRTAGVVHRAVAGKFDEAMRVLTDPSGRANDTDQRRFSLAELHQLVTDAGLVVHGSHGVRVFADLLPGAGMDSDPLAIEALLKLEAAVAELPEFRDLATQLHVLARKG